MPRNVCTLQNIALLVYLQGNFLFADLNLSSEYFDKKTGKKSLGPAVDNSMPDEASLRLFVHVLNEM